MLQHLVALEAHLLSDLAFQSPGLISPERPFEQRAEKHRIHWLQDEIEPAELGPALKKLQMSTGNQKNTLLFGIDIVPLGKWHLSREIPEEQIGAARLFIRRNHTKIPSLIAEPKQYFSAELVEEPITRNQPNSHAGFPGLASGHHPRRRARARHDRHGPKPWRQSKLSRLTL